MMECWVKIAARIALAGFSAVIALVVNVGPALAQQLETLNVSYASVTGSRIPLWIAKDAGLFEKYGLNVNLVVIAAGNAAIGALASGDVEILGAPGATTMISAAKGLPLAIIGTFGPAAWKLAAHPSIASAQDLRGKTVGISRPGTTIDFATRRALQKLGYTPGNDVSILATGLAESNKRIAVMLQGRFDATLVSPDNLFEAETRGWKLSIIADLKELGIITSASDLSAKRDFLKNTAPQGARIHDGVLRSHLVRQGKQASGAGELSQAYARNRRAPAGDAA